MKPTHNSIKFLTFIEVEPSRFRPWTVLSQVAVTGLAFLVF
jgi:hypothetical protein